MSRREVLVFGLVVVAVVLVGLLAVSFFGPLGSGMMGYGMMGPGRMYGVGFGGWLLACLIPLILLGLLIGGAIWLFAASTNKAPKVSTVADHQHCPTCSRMVQPDWQVCPYCGTALRQEVGE